MTHPECSIGTTQDHPRHAFRSMLGHGEVTCPGWEQPKGMIARNRKPPEPNPPGKVLAATPDDEAPAGHRLWIWFCLPDVGPAQMLMVEVLGPDNTPAFRPLAYADQSQAVQQAGVARDAGRSLGVRVELREYACVALHEVVPE